MSDLTQLELWSVIETDAASAFPDHTDKISRYLATPQGERMWRHYQRAGGAAAPHSPRGMDLGHSANAALTRLQREGHAIAEREGVSEAAGLAKATIANPALYTDYREKQRQGAERQQRQLAKQRQDDLGREVARRGIAKG